jgi:selenocysteine lyase/cysteine desulfurase
VREQFVMPPDLGVLNAANLCPSSRPVLEALRRETDSVDRDPSGQNRARLTGEKENTRKALASSCGSRQMRSSSPQHQRVEQPGVERLDLKPGDEVVVHGDNHPSNLNAWRKRPGGSVSRSSRWSRRTRIPAWTTTWLPSRVRSRRGRR